MPLGKGMIEGGRADVAATRRPAGSAWRSCLLAPAGAGARRRGAAIPSSCSSAAFARRYSCSITGVVRIATRKGDAQARDAPPPHRGEVRAGQAPHLRDLPRAAVRPRHGLPRRRVGRPDASEQQFVYLPSMAKVRRVSGSQPTDSFLGTDLSYHDFQRQHPDRYRATPCTPGHARARPSAPSRCSRSSTRRTRSSSTRSRRPDAAILGDRLLQARRPARLQGHADAARATS